MEQALKETENRFFERQLVIFKIGDEEFGVEISDVREIIKYEQVTKIPETKEYMEGIINLRGKIVVIINLAKKLSLPSINSKKNTRVLISEIKGNTVGFVIDSCNEVLRLTGDKIQDAPKIITDKINSEYLQGVGTLDNRLIILIDLGKVLEEDDFSQIKKHDTNGILSAKKVLLVEDSSMMRGTLKSYIDHTRFSILESEDGEDALKIIDANTPDIILLDIKLPKMNGIEVLKKTRETHPNIPIVMVTSVYEDETKNECLRLGAKSYLKKPIDKKQIEDVLSMI